MATPGVLFVYMRPKEGLSLNQFHDWYNNEHGPNRLRLSHIFTNGLRYQATDNQDPPFLAVYDVTDMSHLVSPIYTSLRENRTPREAETIAQVQVDRVFYDLLNTRQSPFFAPIESLNDDDAKGIVQVIVHTTLKDIDGAEAEYRKWFEQEHVDMLSRVPGWLRTRFFRSSSIESAGEVKYLALHTYTKENGLGGPEHKASMSTAWRTQVTEKYVQEKSRREMSLFYVFGSGPRDLDSLSKMPADGPEFVSSGSKETATLTTTIITPGPNASISSYVTTQDALTIPYRLEGNPSPDAPVVAFSNSLLTSMAMWDPLVKIIKAKRPDLKILRYDTRGRHSIPQPPTPSTLDILAADLKSLLDSLRISKLRALIGVSMGGAATTNFALKYPDSLEKFVACDFNVTSSAANTAAWKERIATAESNDGQGIKTDLAPITVSRWFHPASMEKDVASWMTEMVGANDVEGFRYGCQALWDYDLKPQMPTCRVPALLVVGEADGKGALVKAMDGFKGLMGPNGAQLKIVPEAGHLPMSESPEGFWEAIRDFI